MKSFVFLMLLLVGTSAWAQKTTKSAIVKPSTNTTNNNTPAAPNTNGSQNGGNDINGGGTQNGGNEINNGGNNNYNEPNREPQSNQVSITVTDEGKPMAYHNITISQNSVAIGYGQTDGSGYASIGVSSLYGSAVDVEGFYQSGGTKRSWSIKGKLRLDGNNHVNIQLETMRPSKDKDIKDKIRGNKNNGFGDNPFGNNNNNNNGFGNFGGFGNEKVNPDNSGCSPMSSSSFDQELSKIKKEISMMSQDDMIDNLLKNNCLSSNQIAQLVKSSKMMTSQEKIAKAGYARCSDPQNYETVISAVGSRMMQDNVRAATLGK